MGFELEASERVEEGLRRLAAEQVEDAIAALSGPTERHEAIHEARKHLKKVRSVVRVARDALGATYRRENAWFRDVGRTLSRVRDAEALIECVDKLTVFYGEQLEKDGLAHARAALVARKEDLANDLGDLGALAEETAAVLRDAAVRVRRWPLDDADADTITYGVEAWYRRGRVAMSVAYDDPTPDHFHEWRKRVKDHWYHVRLLEPLWPREMKARSKDLERLSDMLGDEHDLVVLQEALAAEPERFGTERERDALAALAARRQAQLREEARPLGQRLYAEKPRALRARLEEYWAAWRAQPAAVTNP